MSDDLVKRLADEFNNAMVLVDQQNCRIEKLESVLRDVVVTLNSEEIPYMLRNRYACAIAKETLDGK